jgi:hypothetical protein
MHALKQGNILRTMGSNIALRVLIGGSEMSTGRLNLVYIYAYEVHLLRKAQNTEFN